MVIRTGRRVALGLLIVSVMTALLGGVAAAQISEDEIQIVELRNETYPEIQVVVDVPQSFSNTDLTSRHFALQEGGVAREIDVEKLQETTAIVLAIDTSGSMNGEPLAVAKQSALAFLDGLPGRHPVAVMGFGDEVLVASGLATDREATRSAIANLNSGGETSLYDALVTGAGLLGESSAERTALVLLSDGADTASVASAGLVVEQLTSADITLYSVGLETGDSRLTDLEQLTGDSDGRYLAASDLSQLGAVYDDLAARLANQYLLSFEATSVGPVQVRVTAAGDNGALASVTTITELQVNASGSAEPAVGDETAAAASVGPTLAESVTEVAPGAFESSWVLLAGVGALFVTFSVMAYTVFSMARAQPRRGLEPRKQSTRRLPGIADWASSLVDRIFLDGQRRGAMNSALDRAGLNVRPGEFIVLTATLGVIGLAAGWIVHPIVGLVCAGVIAVGSRFFVAARGARRRSLFASQLDGTLLVLASSLRAGHGVQRALAAVAEESDAPTGEEFTRVVAETRIGRDLVEALQGVADRLGNDDFDWVVRAVAINRELGGNLSEVLDNVALTIRERNQLRRQVKALSAEGRLSAAVLYVLPIGVALFVRVTNPGYISELTESTIGLVMIGLALVAMVGGGAWIKKIVNVRF